MRKKGIIKFKILIWARHIHVRIFHVEAGIYLMEDPRLKYATAQKYDLKILCYDTYGHEVSGMYYVNIQENRKPIFKNLASK